MRGRGSRRAAGALVIYALAVAGCTRTTLVDRPPDGGLGSTEGVPGPTELDPGPIPTGMGCRCEYYDPGHQLAADRIRCVPDETASGSTYWEDRGAEEPSVPYDASGFERYEGFDDVEPCTTAHGEPGHRQCSRDPADRFEFRRTVCLADCETPGETRACEVDGRLGVQHCVSDGRANTWGACLECLFCALGTSLPCPEGTPFEGYLELCRAYAPHGIPQVDFRAGVCE